MVYFKNYSALPLNKNEVLRYSGVPSSSNATIKLMEECLKEAEVDLDSIKIQSFDLANALLGCDKAVVFAATVGLDIDRLIKKYSNITPSKALMLSAIGTERIESLCEVFCSEILKDNCKITTRFSPGYGDLSINYQKDIIKMLEASKLIGLCLNDSLIMSPSKSVTAIVGIGKGAGEKFKKDCLNCENKDCLYRR